jgi:hypothetical protein
MIFSTHLLFLKRFVLVEQYTYKHNNRALVTNCTKEKEYKGLQDRIGRIYNKYRERYRYIKKQLPQGGAPLYRKGRDDFRL